MCSSALAEDHTNNYKTYSVILNGGGESKYVDDTSLKKYIAGDAVVRLNSLKANGTSISGYGWAEVWTTGHVGLWIERATSISGNDNKVESGNARTYIPYLSGKDNIGWTYKMKMRTPSAYSSSISYTYAGSWSPDM